MCPDLDHDILIVDDEIPNLRLLVDLLEKEGYRVRPAENAQLGIDSALAKPPSLILLDVHMPDMNGFEVCRRLRQDQRTRGIPIIFISALQDVEAKVQGFEAGGVDFITRPFQEPEVLARVRAHTSLHQMQQHLEQLVEERTADLRAATIDREETHQRLVASEASLKAILDAIPDIVVARDLDCRVTYFNRGFSDAVQRLWGVEAHVGLNTVALHTPELRAYWQGIIARVLQGDTHRERFEWKYSEEETRHYELMMAPVVEEGGIAGTAEFSRDITDRVRSQERLQQSEERFRSLVEQSPLAIEIATPAGEISQVNAAWMRLWGLDEDEAVQVAARLNRLADQQSRDLGMAPLIEKAFAGEPVALPPLQYDANLTMDELGLEGIEARARWVQCHLYPVKDADGKIAYVVSTYMDITELRRNEQEAREQREALARVDRATSMGQLTGSIAHELNQPLTGILSNAQAAELILQGDCWERNELAEIMTDIVVDTKRAGDVIRHLRDLYRGQKAEFLPLDLNAVVEETIQLLHSELVVRQVVLTTEAAAAIPRLNGNAIQLQQVLVNLIMNGIQAMRDTPRNDRRIHTATVHEADEVKVWIEDNGPGIDPAHLDRIFEPLATWRPGGTGMGLAISNSIIEGHGGRMWAENLPEGGARVGFAVPDMQEDDNA